MTPAKDITTCFDQMVIVEKYERVISYLYPIAQSMPRKHGVAREMFLQCLLGIPDLLFQAGKSNQVSKIYTADAGLAQLRFWMRFLLSPTGKGLPIGSLTSQLFANVYSNAADRFVHFDLGHHTWARYMDDIVILDDDRYRLMDSFLRLNDYSMESLKLRIGKWHIAPTVKGINFLGYRIWDTHKLLRKDSVTRAKRKVANFLRHDDLDGLKRFVASWSGHAQWANTHNLNTWMENRYGIAF